MLFSISTFLSLKMEFPFCKNIKKMRRKRKSYFNFNIVWNFMLHIHAVWNFHSFFRSNKQKERKRKSTEWFCVCSWASKKRRTRRLQNDDDVFLMVKVRLRGSWRRFNNIFFLFCVCCSLPSPFPTHYLSKEEISHFMNLFPAHSSIILFFVACKK